MFQLLGKRSIRNTPFNTRYIKKALNIDQIKQLFNYPTVDGSGLDKAKNFFEYSVIMYWYKYV
jgi:hypothetical protein